MSESALRERLETGIWLLLGLLLISGGSVMIADAFSGSAPTGRIRSPETEPVWVACFGAGRILLGGLSLAIAASLRFRLHSTRRALALLGAGVALMALLESPLLGTPYSWPSMTGPVVGMLIAWRAVMFRTIDPDETVAP